ncbi:MAG: ABC transporter ATP-binding protein/permease [Tenericutes bacterium]|nr:ABC transporter ATP-binding protein/permease [Mycoplasmatota bacterium]
MIEAYKFIRIYYKDKIRVYIYIICSLLAKICMLIIPYLTKVLIDQIQFGNLEKFKNIVFLLILTMIVFSIFLSSKYYYQNYIEIDILNQLKRDILIKTFNMKNEEIKYLTIGELIQKVFTDTEVIKPLIISTYIEYIINIIYVISIIIIIFFMNKIITVILLILIPIFIIFYKIYVPRIKDISSKVIKEDENLKSLTEEFLSGNIDIKVNSAYKFIEYKLKDKLNVYFKFVLKKTKYIMKYNYILVTGIMNLATLLIYCFGGYLVFKNKISIGTLVSFTLYFSKLWDPVEYFMEFSKELKVQILSLERIKSFLQREEEKEILKEILPKYKKLKIENLSFSYDKRIILDKLNLEINVGDIIGIKGGNGVGKSTLANIITKLIDNYEGSIIYNDINYKNIDPRSIRKKIIYIPAKPFLFRGSIFENITLMDSNENSKLKFKERKDMQQLIEILISNKRDLNMKINNQINNLSSGEQKIIQILRGIFLDGDVYIFDEPVNYVDKKYKQILINFIKNNLNSKSVIIISHDEDIFECCKKVYKLDKNLTIVR